jgi:hypothetical protein
MLIGGIIDLIFAAMILVIGAALVPLGLGAAVVICAIIPLIFGLLAILGGIMAIQRRSWGLALTGAIFCMVSIGFYGLSFILGLIALILIAISKDDFA